MKLFKDICLCSLIFCATFFVVNETVASSVETWTQTNWSGGDGQE